MLPTSKTLALGAATAALVAGLVALSAAPAAAGLYRVHDQYGYRDCDSDDPCYNRNCDGDDPCYRSNDRDDDRYGYDRDRYRTRYRHTVCDSDGDRCYQTYDRYWNYREYYRRHGYRWSY
jgi:hypothetical protein